MGQDKKVLTSFNSLKIIEDKTEIDRDSIEEDCWSYRSECHYTKTVGYYKILTSEIKFGGKLFLPDEFLAENEADKNCIPKFLIGWFSEDLPKCITDKIGNGWEFEEDPKYKVTKCHESSPEHYDIEMIFEATGTRNEE
jgi:hypothetical protein